MSAAATDNEDFLTKSALQQRGWSEKLIASLLGAPDRQNKNRYRASQMVYLWKLDRIRNAEQSEEFRAYQEKRKLASERSKLAATKKRQELLAAIEGLEITVPVLPLAELRHRAIAAWAALMDARGKNRENSGSDADEQTQQRWMVNYLRHELSVYEGALRQTFGQVGVREAEAQIRAKVYRAISTAYPYLLEECERQLHARSG